MQTDINHTMELFDAISQNSRDELLKGIAALEAKHLADIQHAEARKKLRQSILKSLTELFELESEYEAKTLGISPTKEPEDTRLFPDVNPPVTVI